MNISFVRLSAIRRRSLYANHMRTLIFNEACVVQIHSVAGGKAFVKGISCEETILLKFLSPDIRERYWEFFQLKRSKVVVEIIGKVLE